MCLSLMMILLVPTGWWKPLQKFPPYVKYLPLVGMLLPWFKHQMCINRDVLDHLSLTDSIQVQNRKYEPFPLHLPLYFKVFMNVEDNKEEVFISFMVEIWALLICVRMRSRILPQYCAVWEAARCRWLVLWAYYKNIWRSLLRSSLLILV